jgi:hypothetical protein
VGTHAAGYDYSRTGQPDIARDDQDAKDRLISALVADALALLAAVGPETLEGKEAIAYALLALAAGQDVEPLLSANSADFAGVSIAASMAADRASGVCRERTPCARFGPPASHSGLSTR